MASLGSTTDCLSSTQRRPHYKCFRNWHYLVLTFHFTDRWVFAKEKWNKLDVLIFVISK